jgi:hypothetical protein
MQQVDTMPGTLSIQIQERIQQQTAWNKAMSAVKSRPPRGLRALQMRAVQKPLERHPAVIGAVQKDGLRCSAEVDQRRRSR